MTNERSSLFAGGQRGGVDGGQSKCTPPRDGIVANAWMKYGYPRKTMLDVDDLTCPASYRMMQKIGFPYADWTDFHHRANHKIPRELIPKIEAIYQDPQHFEDFEFYPGFSKLLELERYGASILLNSNSTSAGVISVKARRIPQEIPALRPEQLRLNLVTPDDTLRKRVDNDTYIYGDDCPYYVRESPAAFNIMPMVPWSTTPEALELIRGRPVFFVPTGSMYPFYEVAKRLLLIPPEHVDVVRAMVTAMSPIFPSVLSESLQVLSAKPPC